MSSKNLTKKQFSECVHRNRVQYVISSYERRTSLTDPVGSGTEGGPPGSFSYIDRSDTDRMSNPSRYGLLVKTHSYDVSLLVPWVYQTSVGQKNSCSVL